VFFFDPELSLAKKIGALTATVTGGPGGIYIGLMCLGIAGAEPQWLKMLVCSLSGEKRTSIDQSRFYFIFCCFFLHIQSPPKKVKTETLQHVRNLGAFKVSHSLI